METHNLQISLWLTLTAIIVLFLTTKHAAVFPIKAMEIRQTQLSHLQVRGNYVSQELAEMKRLKENECWTCTHQVARNMTQMSHFVCQISMSVLCSYVVSAATKWPKNDLL